MKNAIWHLSFVPLACLGLASTLTARAYGQNSGTGSVESPVPENQQHIPWGGDAKPPEGWNTPKSEEEGRYWGFFLELRNWDTVAKNYDNAADAGWAGHWRTKLERESGLTSSEADEVKKIVSQYFQDDQDLVNKMGEIRAKAIADTPHSWRYTIFADPEYVALHKQQQDLMNEAIAKLVTALGSRSFSRLDLYTRHYKDRMKAAQARKQAESSQGEAQK